MLILAILCMSCFGKESDLAELESPHFWFNGGAGVRNREIFLGGTFTLQHKRVLSSIFWDMSRVSIGEIGISGGPYWGLNRHTFGVTAGPSWVWQRVSYSKLHQEVDQNGLVISSRYDYLDSTRSLMGAGVQLHWIYVPRRLFRRESHGFGFGLQAIGNYNKVEPYASIIGSIYLGKLKKRTNTHLTRYEQIRDGGIIVNRVGRTIAITSAVGTVVPLIYIAIFIDEGYPEIAALVTVVGGGMGAGVGLVTGVTGRIISAVAERKIREGAVLHLRAEDRGISLVFDF